MILDPLFLGLVFVTGCDGEGIAALRLVEYRRICSIVYTHVEVAIIMVLVIP